MTKFHTFSKCSPAPSTLRKMYLLNKSQSVSPKPIKSFHSKAIKKFIKNRTNTSFKSHFSSTPSSSSNSLNLVTLNLNEEIHNLILYNGGNTKEHYDLFLFNYIVNILKTNPINKNTQLMIEKFLFEQGRYYTQNKEDPIVLNIDISKFTGKFNEYCINKVEELEVYFDKFKNSLNSNNKLIDDSNSLNDNQIIDYYIKEIINTIKFYDVLNIMYYTLFKIVSYNDTINIDDNEDKGDDINHTYLLHNNLFIGKNLVNIYIKNLYDKLPEKDPNLTYSKFRESYISQSRNNNLNNDSFYLHLGAKIIDIMMASNMLEVKVIYTSYKNSAAILRLTDEVSKLLVRKNSIISLPINLPMIVKPKSFSDKEYGGYLLNDVEYNESLIKEKIAYDIPSSIQDENIIYFVVNKMMETPFKVNKELLNYLIEYNHIHKLLINPDYKHEFSDIKRNKIQESEYQNFISKKILEEYVIKIAQTYSNIPEIFFPIKLDNRGRLYPTPAYFHYQANELAKALILFARPDKLKRTDKDAIDYLKAYGGTCFGNGLNKKSYTKRLDWVDKNWNDIIKFNTSDLVNKAENKFLFLSFCFEMKRFNNFLNNEYISEFNTYLPVQLDGTCNGFQHLTLLSNESKLFEALNLFESNKNEDPKDFYQHIINQINIHLENNINSSKSEKEKESYNRLLKLGLSRSNIKHVIMTKPYNAKDETLLKYILDTLTLNHTDKKLVKDENGMDVTVYTKWYKINKDTLSENFVNRQDIELLVQSINDIIYVNYPNIKLLSLYLNGIAKIFNKLNLPIIWRLPTGLLVSQKYMQRHTTRIKPFAYLNTSLSLTITDKINIDKQKQITALMPNLVHSLDAASLSLLYNSFYNSIEGDHVNFYSVHDCFGVTAKYIDSLITLLRSVYIAIYSDIGYLEKFDKDVINNIITFYGEEQCSFNENTRIMYVDRKKIVLPPLPNIVYSLKNNNFERLAKSLYHIK